MSLVVVVASVSSIVYFCDSFWGEFDLNTLRNLISVSKGFHDELVLSAATTTTTASVQKKSNSGGGGGRNMIEHALLSMIRTRPAALNGWVLDFQHAKHCFSLPMHMMLHHCSMALPVWDRCYRSYRENIYKNRNKHAVGPIHFIDAYRLTAGRPGGLKAAMERRHQLEVKVQASARALIEKVGNRYALIEANARTAVDELKLALPNGCRSTRIRYLQELIFSTSHAAFHMASTVEQACVCRVTHESSHDVHISNKRFKTLVARYRTHSVYCLLVMTLDFLE